MSKIPDKCSRCGAPISWKEDSLNIKCDYCGNINYLKNDFFNQFKSNLNFKNSKKILLNPISIFVIILLPVVFNRLITQINKYKRFDSAYLAEKACEEDEAKLRSKNLSVRCDYQEKNTVQLISYESKTKSFAFSEKFKKDMGDKSLKSSLNFRKREMCNNPLEKKGGSSHKKYTDQINKYISDRVKHRIENLKNSDYYGYKLNRRFELSYPLKRWAEKVGDFYYTRNDLNEIGYPIDDEYGLSSYEQKKSEWNLHYLLPNLKLNRVVISGYSSPYYPTLSPSLKESRKRKIDWLENFISKRNEKFAWELVRLDHSKALKDCLEDIRDREISDLVSMILKSPAMKKCKQELAKKEKILFSKDNYNSSLSCTHPFVERKNESNKNIIWKELIKDIKLTEEKNFIKKYYLY